MALIKAPRDLMVFNYILGTTREKDAHAVELHRISKMLVSTMEMRFDQANEFQSCMFDSSMRFEHRRAFYWTYEEQKFT